LAKVENLHLREMPEIVKELKRETAIAVKQFNWTESQAQRIYNRSVSIMHLLSAPQSSKWSLCMKISKLWTYIDCSVCASCFASFAPSFNHYKTMLREVVYKS
jgi:hypothetical protein